MKEKKKKKKHEDERYVLTPRGIAVVALIDSGLMSIDDFDDAQFESFWDKFTSLMEKNGYIQT